MPNNKEILSENLKYYMNVKKIDRRNACNELDLNYSTVSDWLNGKKYPRMEKIQRLADYFNVSVSDLIEQHTASSVALDNLIKLISAAKKNGYSQKEFADLLDVSIEELQQLEDGHFSLKKLHDVMFDSFLNMLDQLKQYDVMHAKLHKLDLTQEQLQEVYSYAEYIKYKGMRK